MKMRICLHKGRIGGGKKRFTFESNQALLKFITHVALRLANTYTCVSCPDTILVYGAYK